MSAREELAAVIHHKGWPQDPGWELRPERCSECADALRVADAALASPALADLIRDRESAQFQRVRALAKGWLRLSGAAMDAEVREWTSAAGRSVLAALDDTNLPTAEGGA